jgi:hypothetical protein
MLPAFDRSNGDRVNDEPRLEAGLDREKSAQLAQHHHSNR